MASPDSAHSAPPRDEDGSGRRFTVLALSFTGVVVLLCIVVAQREWFFGDDFVFLMQAQRPIDWGHVFLPIGPRGWWSYRPLTIDVFFASSVSLAGLRPLPLILVSVAVHFATGGLVARIARQIGLERRVALFVGVLSVLMYPSIHELFWASTFQHVGARFWYLAAVSCFAEYLLRGDRRWLFATLGCQVVLAGCNELGVTLPAPLVLLAMALSPGDLRARGLATLRTVWAPTLLMGAYAAFRWGLLGPAMLSAPPFYLPQIGWHVPLNVGTYLYFVTHESFVVAALVVALLAGTATLLWRDREAVELRIEWGTRLAVCIPWMVASVVPFVGMLFAHHRMAMIMEAPFCLLVGAQLDALMRMKVLPARTLEWAMLALLVAAVPYASLLDQAQNPRGGFNRDLVTLLSRHYPDLESGDCVALIPTDDRSFSIDERFAMAFRTAGLMGAHYPGERVDLRLPGKPGQTADWSRGCKRLQLAPGPVVLGPRGEPAS